MWDRHPVRLSLLHMVPGVAEDRGVALTPLLARAGLSDGEMFGREAVVARAQVCTLLHHLAHRSGDPTIGLDLAAAADPVRLRMAGQALFAGRTLRECLAGLTRQMPDLQGGVTVEVDERDGTARWRHTFSDSDREHAAVLNDGVTGFMVGAFEAITGLARQDLRVELPHRASAPARLYEDKLGAPVTFGPGEGIVLSFDVAWLDRPNRLIRGVAPDFSEAVEALVPNAVWLDDSELPAVIDRLFESAAFSGTLSLIDTAQSLGVAPRTLQRRLAGLGTSFEVQLDAWRRARARAYLGDAGLQVATIARALGYGDPAHFIRAFRRWEGRTPLAFRRAVLRDASA
ncbi:AraC family transcriptional regulator [Segnochrobactrum spirostomi]|uniref:AraC family transcriptional regulator n=1 Tax=Segnochrobactrum spirostomi TaxID=2608987 RepID=A0A6A7Y845_9HYPH|nr:AraC family transcriptional regulator [Segnochrobactrum spirostomi]MQT15463.1 AraC family transcriptional regulator [Segnochrobactrum spirostomi]